jgi:D-glycero-D-manno-heptose 1,7-bisphosphate phosphatase
LRPAIILDRGGVINQEKNYVHRIEDFVFLDGVFAACREFQEAAGLLLVITTNQAGIARGYYDKEDYQHLTAWMQADFSRLVVAYWYQAGTR